MLIAAKSPVLQKEILPFLKMLTTMLQKPGYSNTNERLMIISAKSLDLNDRVLPLSKMLTTMPVLNLSMYKK